MEYAVYTVLFILFVVAVLMYIVSKSVVCAWGHDWSSWRAPVEVKSMYYDFKYNREFPYIEKIQSRTCSRCGLLQEHSVDKPERV